LVSARRCGNSAVFSSAAAKRRLKAHPHLDTIVQ
jgi:hypothetical protein